MFGDDSDDPMAEVMQLRRGIEAEKSRTVIDVIHEEEKPYGREHFNSFI